jgi:hypothetical protein
LFLHLTRNLQKEYKKQLLVGVVYRAGGRRGFASAQGSGEGERVDAANAVTEGGCFDPAGVLAATVVLIAISGRSARTKAES